MINSYDSAFRITRQWTVDLRQFLSQRLIDIRYGFLASAVMTKSLKHLDRLISYLSNTALVNSASLRFRPNEDFKRDPLSVEWPILVLILVYGPVIIVSGSTFIIVLLPFLLFYFVTCPIWLPMGILLVLITRLTDMDGKTALQANSKACIVLHPLSWEVRTIRIITIQPGSPGESIVCEMHICNFETEEYEALSYVWGPAILNRKICVSGKPVYVTDELYHAMKHLRHRDKPRFIWIDALCIDQNDLDDRARQVSQMRGIYKSATRVIIWLGRSPWCLDDAFSRAQQSPAPAIYNYGTTRAVSKLLQRGWWQRAWVVQELVVAREVLVQCGFVSLTWDSFVQLVDTSAAMPWFSDSDTFVDEYHALKHYRQTRLQDINPDYGLLSFVHAFRHKMASDPRDKIYAFLGLVLPLDRNASSVQPNYTLSHTSLCHGFAINCIRETQSLNILAYSQTLRPNFPSLNGRRSWCPYWDSSTGVRQAIPLWDGDLDTSSRRNRWRHAFSASGSNSAALWELRDNDALSVKGVFLETVAAVGTAFSPSFFEDVDSDRRPSTASSPAKLFSRDIRYEISPYRAFSHWKTMVTGASGRPEKDVMRAFHQTLTAGLYDHIPGNTDQTSEYLSVRDEVCMYRTVFITESGGFGLGPGSTRPGDRLAILLGCDVPVVLRHINGTDSPAEPGLDIESLEAQNLYQTDFDDAYKYVGQAYIHDCMVYNGDLAQDILKAGRTLDDITLL